MDWNTHLRQPSTRGRGLSLAEGGGLAPIRDDGLMLAEHEFPIRHVQAPTYDDGLIPVAGELVDHVCVLPNQPSASWVANTALTAQFLAHIRPQPSKFPTMAGPCHKAMHQPR